MSEKVKESKLLPEEVLPPSFYFETLKAEHLKIEELAYALNGLANITRLVYCYFAENEEHPKEGDLRDVLLSYASIFGVFFNYAMDRKEAIQEAVEKLQEKLCFA